MIGIPRPLYTLVITIVVIVFLGSLTLYSPEQTQGAWESAKKHVPFATDNGDVVSGGLLPSVKLPSEPGGVVMLLASDGKGSNGGIVGLLDKAIEDRTAYAKYHGYDFMFTNTTKYDLSRFGDKIHPVWAKIPAIKDAFDTYPDAEWVWWLDQDAIIMTPQINLWDHILSPKAMKQKLLKNEMFRVSGGREIGFRTPAEINPDEINFIVANDQNGFNAGSFLIRRSEWTEWLLENWLNPIYVQKDWPGREQDAFGHMVEFNKKIRDHTGLVNQRLFNSYAHIKWDFMGFFPGDLVVHLAGCWVNKECKEIWDEMWAMRQKLPVKA